MLCIRADHWKGRTRPIIPTLGYHSGCRQILRAGFYETNMKIPVVDIGSCSVCGGCIEVSPEVFRLNAAGYIEVIMLDEYPAETVDEAIKYCPEDCIQWENDK